MTRPTHSIGQFGTATVGREKIILLAEDDANDAFIIGRALSKSMIPHRLVHVHDGQECIDYLLGRPPYQNRGSHLLPDLLLLDLKMPLVTGRELLAWLGERREFFDVPVIVLTGSEMPRDREQAIREGACAFHSKASDPVELTLLIEAMLAGSKNSPRAANLNFF